MGSGHEYVWKSTAVERIGDMNSNVLQEHIVTAQ